MRDTETTVAVEFDVQAYTSFNASGRTPDMSTCKE